ncbi:hypothetical protein [Halorussus sp. AFM4]|uniref:hypothetical protein n=1 Tax=Halorussus sp. AFM4 TaxID=3421651 RepID=UPI003EC10D01
MAGFFTWQSFASFFPTFLMEYVDVSTADASLIFGAVFALPDNLRMGLTMNGIATQERPVLVGDVLTVYLPRFYGVRSFCTTSPQFGQ